MVSGRQVHLIVVHGDQRPCQRRGEHIGIELRRLRRERLVDRVKRLVVLRDAGVHDGRADRRTGRLPHDEVVDLEQQRCGDDNAGLDARLLHVPPRQVEVADKKIGAISWKHDMLAGHRRCTAETPATRRERRIEQRCLCSGRRNGALVGHPGAETTGGAVAHRRKDLWVARHENSVEAPDDRLAGIERHFGRCRLATRNKRIRGTVLHRNHDHVADRELDCRGTHGLLEGLQRQQAGARAGGRHLEQMPVRGYARHSGCDVRPLIRNENRHDRLELNRRRGLRRIDQNPLLPGRPLARPHHGVAQHDELGVRAAEKDEAGDRTCRRRNRTGRLPPALRRFRNVLVPYPDGIAGTGGHEKSRTRRDGGVLVPHRQSPRRLLVEGDRGRSAGGAEISRNWRLERFAIAELGDAAGILVERIQMQRAIGCNAREHRVRERSLAQGRQRGEGRIRHLEAELRLRRFLRERLLAAQVEGVELLRFLAERKEHAVENDRRGVRHALGSRRSIRCCIRRTRRW